MKRNIYNGIRSFKKEYFNDALSIVTGILIISAVLLLFLSKIDKVILVTKSEEIEIVPLMLFEWLIFAPIVEELVFRCALGLFGEKIIKNDIVINVITAIIFSFFHLFKMKLNIVEIIFYGIIYYMLGYACGYYYRKTDNIILSMYIHFIWNMFMVVSATLRNIL